MFAWHLKSKSPVRGIRIGGLANPVATLVAKSHEPPSKPSTDSPCPCGRTGPRRCSVAQGYCSKRPQKPRAYTQGVLEAPCFVEPESYHVEAESFCSCEPWSRLVIRELCSGVMGSLFKGLLGFMQGVLTVALGISEGPLRHRLDGSPLFRRPLRPLSLHWRLLGLSLAAIGTGASTTDGKNPA